MVDNALAELAHIGGPRSTLADDEVARFIEEQLDGIALDGSSVCVLVPDATRNCPLALLLSAIHRSLHGRASRITVLVALGTHAPMGDQAIATMIGSRPERVSADYPGIEFCNHEWWNPSSLADVGLISDDRVAELSEGRLRRAVAVRINRAVLEHDVTLIVGPVLPHEVVGFSGGNKYLFPGVSDRELIDVSHWLGALITSAEIIGTKGITPVRAIIDEAASMVPGRHLALCVVTDRHGALHSLSFGTPEEAWAAAVDVSAEAHINYLDAPVARVLSLLSPRYDDMWTGAKGFYKVEPVVADGGQVVIYAPHISEISRVHPDILQIGYHCRDYFLAHWDRYQSFHWGDLAHSTHLRGAGTFTPGRGERFRVTVTLATAIPEQVVRSVNLDYLDPGTVSAGEWATDPSTLVVPDGGEDLYRLR